MPAFLEISYVGYQTDTIKLQKASDIKIALQPDIHLKEIQVKKTNFFYFFYRPHENGKDREGRIKKAACCNLSESFQTNASAGYETLVMLLQAQGN